MTLTQTIVTAQGLSKWTELDSNILKQVYFPHPTNNQSRHTSPSTNKYRYCNNFGFVITPLLIFLLDV